MQSQSKKYTLLGYFNDRLVLCATTKVNSPKQAQQRFIQKYGVVLVGDWIIKVKLQGRIVHSFKFSSQLELIT